MTTMLREVSAISSAQEKRLSHERYEMNRFMLSVRQIDYSACDAKTDICFLQKFEHLRVVAFNDFADDHRFSKNQLQALLIHLSFSSTDLREKPK
jgi:hypothetical protein